MVLLARWMCRMKTAEDTHPLEKISERRMGTRDAAEKETITWIDSIHSLIWTSLNFVLSIPYLICRFIQLQLAFTIDTSAENFNSEVFTMKPFDLDKIRQSHFLFIHFYRSAKINFYSWRCVCLERIDHANKIQWHMLEIYECFQVSE